MNAICPECGTELEIQTGPNPVYPEHDMPSKRTEFSKTICVGSGWHVEDDEVVWREVYD